MTIATLLSGTVVAEAQPTIVGVQTSSPRVIVVTVQSGPHTGRYTNPIDTSVSAWRINDKLPSRVNLYSIPYDELPEANGQYPVTMRHRVHLAMDESLRAGQSYTLDTPFGSAELNFDLHKTICESIKVNQVGYNARSTSRYANLGVYMGDGGSLKFDSLPKYSVVEETSGRTVASGTAVYMGDDTSVGEKSVTSGEHVYRLSLNDVPAGGPYFVVVDGFGRSYPFGVGNDYSRTIAAVHTRGFYHQRCGIELSQPYTNHTRATCHNMIAHTRARWSADGFIRVPSDATMHPACGGHHDAADFDIRPFHVTIPIFMLAYFDAFPTHFVDNQYNIPESGNGIPDFLDEALWNVLGWEHLQVADSDDPEYGGIMQGFETSGHPAYGIDSAARDSAKRRYGTWEVSVEVSAFACGFFGQASRLVAPYDAKRAASLLDKAKLAWAYLESHADVKQPKTRFMYAALQMYLATGEAKYHELFKASADTIVARDAGGWPEQYLAGNTTAKCDTTHFVSYLVTSRPTDETLKQSLANRILKFADTGDYMGPAPEKFPYAQGVTKFLGWGSGTATGRYANAYCFAYLLTDDPTKKQNYFNAVSQYADYALGLNPLGMSYTTGLGTVQPVSTLQLDSYFTKYGKSDTITNEHVDKPIGQVPGIVIFGPASGYSGAEYQRAITDKLYPAWDDLPGERRWGDGWSLINGNEFTVNDTMLWNTVMHGFLYDASQDKNATSFTH